MTPQTGLPRSMPAVVCHGPGDYRLEERPVPLPGPEEVVVRVRSAGICASDLKCYLGAPLFWGDKHRGGYCQAPVIPGTELNIHGAHLGPGCYPVAIDMIQRGLLPMDRIVTHRLPLQKFQEGIDLVAAGDRSIKVTVEP